MRPFKAHISLHISTAWPESLDSQGFHVSSGIKLRFWSDCADEQTGLNNLQVYAHANLYFMLEYYMLDTS